MKRYKSHWDVIACFGKYLGREFIRLYETCSQLLISICCIAMLSINHNLYHLHNYMAVFYSFESTWFNNFNHLILNFQHKNKDVLTFHAIVPHWHGTDSWTPYSCKTTTCRVYVVYIMAADDQASQGARAWTKIFIILNRISLVPARESLRHEMRRTNVLWLHTNWCH